MLLVGRLEATSKRTSIYIDVQEILAEPFPGTVAQGVVLVIAKDFRRL
jgi:hypothetical protein